MKNRTLDKEAAKLMIVNSIGKDPNFSPIIGGAFDKCYERVAAIPAHANAKCSFAPAFLMNCIDAELFKVSCRRMFEVVVYLLLIFFFRFALRQYGTQVMAASNLRVS